MTEELPGRSDAAEADAPAQQPLVAVTLAVPLLALEPTRALCEAISPEGLVLGDQGSRATITVYVPRTKGDAAAEQLRAAGERGIEAVGAEVTPQIEVSEVPGDWRDRWKEFHRPVVIGSLWIGPPWCLPAPEGRKTVVIEPGQGFGTGAHPTTRLVIGLLRDLPEGTVVDLGTGSGVLSVAAARLGHRVVWAVDNDPAAVASATENAARNNVRVPVAQADLLSVRTTIPQADTALANITLGPLRQIVPRLRHRNVIVSGLLTAQRDVMTQILEAAEYAVAAEAGRDGWIALRAVRRSEPIDEAPPALW